jgi:inward rectifier potassium channel
MANREIRERLIGALAPAKTIFQPHKSRPRVRHIGPRRIITEGLETNLWTDLYHNAMTVSWPVFFVWLAGIFVAFNLLFAAVYRLAAAPIANARPGSFLDLFFFSVQTMAGVGYGYMYPQSLYGHVAASCESFLSLVSLAVMTGLVFARFSRPRARLIFARNPVVAMHDGAPTLMVRIANARNNFISNADARLWGVRGTISKEGRRMTSFQEMRLQRRENPVFALSWTLFHVIDSESLLSGMSAEDIAASDMNFMVTISGLDETSAQVVHARNGYSAQDLRVGHEFVDIISVDENGMRRVDYAKIHETRPSAR